MTNIHKLYAVLLAVALAAHACVAVSLVHANEEKGP